MEFNRCGKSFQSMQKKVFAFEMTAPLETILVAKVLKGRWAGMVFEGTTECVNVFSVSFPNE